MSNLTHLDLFSGIGGFALAAKWCELETVAFCEIDPFCQRVLAKNFPGVPIYDDVRAFPCDKYPRPFLLTGGFPCQPYSVAGLRRGADDDRALWPAMLEVIKATRPTWVLGENVAGFVSMGLDHCLSDLEGAGYETRAFIVPACAVNAHHRRDRVWIVAHAMRNEQPRNKSCNGAIGRMGREFKSISWNGNWKSALCEFRGMDDGLSYGVDRLDSIRNAIVPQVAEQIIRAMMQADNERK
jgi:DNA (cytosine-5)-methyltransferase 1